MSNYTEIPIAGSVRTALNLGPLKPGKPQTMGLLQLEHEPAMFVVLDMSGETHFHTWLPAMLIPAMLAILSSDALERLEDNEAEHREALVMLKSLYKDENVFRTALRDAVAGRRQRHRTAD